MRNNSNYKLNLCRFLKVGEENFPYEKSVSFQHFGDLSTKSKNLIPKRSKKCKRKDIMNYFYKGSDFLSRNDKILSPKNTSSRHMHTARLGSGPQLLHSFRQYSNNPMVNAENLGAVQTHRTQSSQISGYGNLTMENIIAEHLEPRNLDNPNLTTQNLEVKNYQTRNSGLMNTHQNFFESNQLEVTQAQGNWS